MSINDNYINKHVILIPYWIQEALQRNNLPMVACLDYVRLKNIVSQSDLAGFVALDNEISRFFNMKDLWGRLTTDWRNALTRPTVFTSGVITSDDGPAKGFQFTESKDDTLNAEIGTIQRLSSDSTLQAEVLSRLFDESSKTDRYPTPFITYDLTREVCGVVVFPGHFIVGKEFAYEQDLIESIRKVLYGTLPGNEVAKTPYFKRYLELLSSQDVKLAS